MALSYVNSDILDLSSFPFRRRRRRRRRPREAWKSRLRHAVTVSSHIYYMCVITAVCLSKRVEWKTKREIGYVEGALKPALCGGSWRAIRSHLPSVYGLLPSTLRPRRSNSHPYFMIVWDFYDYKRSYNGGGEWKRAVLGDVKVLVGNPVQKKGDISIYTYILMPIVSTVVSVTILMAVANKHTNV